MTRSLVIVQPFDLALTLEMGQAFRWHRRGDEGYYWYSGVLGPHLVHIRQTGDGVEYRASGSDGELDDIDLSHALHEYFRLGDDIADIYTELRRDPVVACAVGKYPGSTVAAAGAGGVPRVLRVFQNEEHPRHSEQREGHREAEPRHGQAGRRRAPRLPHGTALGRSGKRRPERTATGLEQGSQRPPHRSMAGRQPAGLLRLAGPPASTADVVRRLEGFPGVGPKISGCVALMSLGRLDAVSGGPVGATGPCRVRPVGDAPGVGGEGRESARPDGTPAVPRGRVGSRALWPVRGLRRAVPVPLGRAPQGARCVSLTTGLRHKDSPVRRRLRVVPAHRRALGSVWRAPRAPLVSSLSDGLVHRRMRA